jgi:hypothetical protein
MTITITIDPRFNGPPNSANGGYACGRLAAFTPQPAEVTLRRPVPIGVPLRVERHEGQATLHHEEELIAEARAAALSLKVPAPPTFEEAQQAAENYLGYKRHSWNTCFVCGTAHPTKSSLQVRPGLLAGRDVVATPWVPPAWAADSEGRVEPAFLWAVLDCPGEWAALGAQHRSIVLGRLTAEVTPGIRAGERCVVIGWPLKHEGRKSFVGTALFDSSGALRGRGHAIWFEVKAGS